MAVSPFDYVEKLSSGDDPWAFWIENNDGKGYNPFLVNRALSYHIDTVMIAWTMSRLYWLPPVIQYMFIISTIRHRRRPKKWVPVTNKDALVATARYYRCNLRTARETQRLLDKIGA